MAEIAVSMAKNTADGLLGKLADKLYGAVSKEISLLLRVRGEIAYIIDELEMINAFIRGAEEKENYDWAAWAWVKQVKQLAYSIEDCIDEFSLHLSRASNETFMSGMRRRVRSIRSLGARHDIATQIQEIKSRVKEVSDRRARYGINEITKELTSSSDLAAQHDPRAAALFVEESQLVGIDAPKGELVKWLLEGDKQLSLKAVLGAGGLGKTTIARKAYESPEVSAGQFTCRAWVTVSQSFDLDELLRDMAKQLSLPPAVPRRGQVKVQKDELPKKQRDELPKDVDKIGRRELIPKLKEYLSDKRYVIVFDDIWQVEAWTELKTSLYRNDLGSRVILTTRNKEVAEACRIQQLPCEIYQPDKLSSQQSMELFCRRVFNKPTCPEDLADLSEKILDKCDGLPLAIVSIAGLLASKPEKSKQEWDKVLQHLGSELEHNPNLKGMKQVLDFSYNGLPYHLKPCFLYLSKFPEDCLINCKRIQRLWIAEGLVESRHDMTSEEVAEAYISTLINRCLILPLEFSTNGKVKSFRLHDIILELIVSKSMEKNFVTLIREHSTMKSPEAIRRLSIHSNNIPENLLTSHIRSLTISGGGIPEFTSHAFRLLKVLDFEDCEVVDDDHISMVGRLLHLKYLSLKNTGVSKLPKSIGYLRNLELLDIRSTYTVKIPAEICKLQQLRFLLTGRKKYYYCRVPRGLIGLLRNLEELTGVIVGESKGIELELRKLTKLRKLFVYDIKGHKEMKFCESLKKLSASLRSLSIYTDLQQNYLQTLSTTFPKLETLKLHLYTEDPVTFPIWISSGTNLLKVYLYGTFVDTEEAIQALGDLPQLTQLTLCIGAPGEQRTLCFGAEGFRRLKRLYIDLDVDRRYPCIQFDKGAMVSLELLSLEAYYAQNAPEDIFGLENLGSLKKVDLTTDGDGDKSFEILVKKKLEAHPNCPTLTVKE